MKKRTTVRVTKEKQDVERELSSKRLTEQEIREKLPKGWHDRAEIGRAQIEVPIRGSKHYC